MISNDIEFLRKHCAHTFDMYAFNISTNARRIKHDLYIFLFKHFGHQETLYVGHLKFVGIMHLDYVHLHSNKCMRFHEIGPLTIPWFVVNHFRQLLCPVKGEQCDKACTPCKKIRKFYCYSQRASKSICYVSQSTE